MVHTTFFFFVWFQEFPHFYIFCLTHLSYHISYHICLSVILVSLPYYLSVYQMYAIIFKMFDSKLYIICVNSGSFWMLMSGALWPLRAFPRFSTASHTGRGLLMQAPAPPLGPRHSTLEGNNIPHHHGNPSLLPHLSGQPETIEITDHFNSTPHIDTDT